MAPLNSTMLHDNIVRIRTPTLALASREVNVKEESNDDVDNDLKSISNQSINIQADDQVEIPIWIRGEPRYVSGLTSKTTCDDVLRALIEDELHYIDASDTSNAYCLSRDFHDYVITEKWRDIEQALPGDTYILPIWNEWGVAQNEVKLKLKINKFQAGVAQCVKGEKPKREKSHKGKKINAISKLIQKVIKQGEVIHNQLSNYRLNTSTRHRLSKRFGSIRKSRVNNHPTASKPDTTGNFDFLPKDEAVQTDDEILLVLHPNDEDKDSGINIHAALPTDHPLERHFHSISEISMTHLPYESVRFPYPKLNRLAKHEFVSSTPHSASRRRKSLQFNVIRNEIVETTQSIEDLLQSERQLARHLTKKRDKYRAQNDLYRTKAGLDVCVEEIQENLATYGKEIVENELDLYKIKKEIRRRSIVLSNLKRMLDVDDDATMYQSVRYGRSSSRRFNLNRTCGRGKHSEFVDNIYEFCDNNESIVV